MDNKDKQGGKFFARNGFNPTLSKIDSFIAVDLLKITI